MQVSEPDKPIILFKGMDTAKDSYPTFQALNSRGRGFLALLQDMQINQLFVGGLAMDYCVKFSVLDALRCGFKVYLLIDAMKGVDLTAGDSRRAVQVMIGNGAYPIKYSQAQS